MKLKVLRLVAIVATVCSILLGLYTLPRLVVNSDILALFPAAQQSPDIDLAGNQLKARIERKVVFLLSSPTWEATRNAAPEFVQQLRQCSCFAAVNATPDSNTWMAIQQQYAGFAPALLTPVQREFLEQGGANDLVQRALRDLLTNPGVAVGDRLQRDPLGTAGEFLGQINPSPDGFSLDESGFIRVTRDNQDYLLVYAELADSPYSLALQQQAGAAIKAAKLAFSQVSGGGILHSGALFYAQAGTQQAQSEISTVGLGSMLGIIALLLVVFRSWGLLVLAFVPIVAGLALGLALCHWLFGQIHAVTLVFGASLVGVGQDYALHFFSLRQSSGPHWQPERGLRELLPALSLGVLISAAAYFSFSLAGFPGLTQVAVFSSVGLLAAYGVVVGVYPAILRRPSRNVSPAFLLTITGAYLDWFAARRRTCGPLVLGLSGVLVCAGLAQLGVNDDLRRMQTLDPDLVAMDRQLRQIIGQHTALQYFVVRADDDEALLQKLESLAIPLQVLQQQGLISQYQSLTRWLPSAASQNASRTIWRDTLINSGRMADFLNQLGVRPDVAAKLLEYYDAPPEQPLTLQQLWPHLQQLPDAPVWYSVDDRSYGVILLQGLTDPEALRSLADPDDGVFWVDKVAQINQLLRDYRIGASGLLIFAYLLTVLVLIWRYGWRGSLAIVAPPALATILTLSVMGWANQNLSIFNLMALVLLLGVGMDAALFMREGHAKPRQTLVAVGLCGISTVLSFGLLALSDTTAIHSFGLTLWLGITFCCLLAPLAMPRPPGIPMPTLKPAAPIQLQEVDTNVK